MQEAAAIWGFIILALCGLFLGLLAYLLQFKKRLSRSEEQLKKLYLKEQHLNNELIEFKNKFTQEILRDGVTGLPSLSVFKEQVDICIKQSQRYKSIFGILFVDIKNFRVINNALGYAKGDALLKEVAERLQSSIRQVDSLCRISGDVFVVLLSKLSHPESSTLIVRRFFQVLSEPFQLGRHSLSLAASVGIAIYPLDGENLDTLLKNAGHALSKAKEAGPEQYHFYDKEMHDQSEREFLLSSALSSTSLFEELTIEYQPQMDIRNNSIFSWEVLLRWQHPVLGMVPAREFIRLLENAGKIEVIGEWVLQQVCQQMHSWRLMGYVLPSVSINISLQQLESPHFISRMLRILLETQVDAKLLIFEISENDFLAENEVVDSKDKYEKVFSILSQLGVRVAIDHFSAGDALLKHLKNLPVDYLKISSDFIRELNISSEAEAIVNMMLVLAKSLNKRIIALGVETEAQKRVLERLECRLMQGHLFSLPLKEKEVAKKLRLSDAKPVQEEDLTVS